MKRPADCSPWADRKALDTAHELFPNLRDYESLFSQRVSEMIDRAGDADGLDLLRMATLAERELQAAEWQLKAEASRQLAVKIFPEVADQSSRIHRLTVEIDDELKAKGDLPFWSPDKPFIIAALAARRAGEEG